MKNIGYRSFVPVALLTAALLQAGCSKSSSGTTNGPSPKVIDGKAKGPSTVPVINDGVAPSADRQTIDKAVARAQQENKKIILEIGAAWCGPCTEFKFDMDNHPDYLKELGDNGYVFVKAEFEKMVYGGGLDFMALNDYMPVYVSYFPSFYVYDNGTWVGIGSVNNYDELKTALAGNIQPMSLAEVKAALQEQKSSDATTARVNSSIFGNFIGVYTYAEAKEIVGLLSTSANKANYPGLADYVQSSIWEYVGVNAVSVQQLTVDFPEAAAAITDASNGAFNTEPFTYMLASSWRTSGLKQTLAQCESKWQAYRSQIKPGTLSAADFQTKLAKLDDSVHVTCAHLEMQVTGVTQTLKDKVSKIDAAHNKDWAMLAAIGQVDAGVDVYHKHYQTFADDYATMLDSDKTDLDKAKAGGDKDQIAQAQHTLDIDTFRAKYHAEVDTDVEGDLRCGVSETSLKILN